MVDVVDVTVLADFRVRLRFDGGEEGEVDLRPSTPTCCTAPRRLGNR